ncbi:SPFH domain-containing protein [Uliginosibacterium sp. TH139]|uniref:SPFH domain-containing protein n=1 Tax=Uliginosibacterium sp. TH139 TaxID=2067453 RepID=UPI00130412F7|nr:SPFH domain-containing protein [Uliginosibacterium sp. TH139]
MLAQWLSKVGGFLVLILIGLFALSGVFGTIGTGNVGIRTTLGVISPEEIPPGIYMKWPFISKVQEFTAKEIAIDVQDLTPKARDNLSLRDMDITIYYHVAPGGITELQAKYANQSTRDEESGVWFPAHGLVSRLVRNAAYEEVSRVDSLILHTKRDEIAAAMHKNVQAQLEANDPKVFSVSRVVIRSVMTDPSIEESIRAAVANQKRLEAMTIQTEIAKREAQIKITEAEGIAKAQAIISGSLTREYLQHEVNQALAKFAEKGSAHTVVIPANMSSTPLINIPAAK